MENHIHLDIQLEKAKILQRLQELLAQIEFDEENHIYKYYGERFESVTGKISLLENKVDFNKIAEISNTKFDSKYYNMGTENIIKMWKDKGKLASARGTLVHHIAELIAIGEGDKIEKTPLTESIEKQIRKFFEENKVEVVKPEVIVFDIENKVAGMIDLITINSDGTLSLWDWKTNEKEIDTKNPYKKFYNEPINNVPFTKYGGYSLQLQTYKLMLEKLGFNIKDTNIIYICDDYYKIIPTLKLKEESEKVLNSTLSVITRE